MNRREFLKFLPVAPLPVIASCKATQEVNPLEGEKLAVFQEHRFCDLDGPIVSMQPFEGQMIIATERTVYMMRMHDL